MAQNGHLWANVQLYRTCLLKNFILILNSSIYLFSLGISCMVLLAQYCLKILTWFCFPQWKLHLFELEGELKNDPSVKYVLYQVCIYFHFFQAPFYASSPQRDSLKISDDCLPFRMTCKLSYAFICFVLVQQSS